MSIFHIATVLVYVTSVLTSTVNQSLEPDENPPPALQKLFGSSITNTKYPTLSTETRSVNNSDSAIVSELDSTKPIITEGGPVLPKKGIKSSITADVPIEEKSSSIGKLRPTFEKNIPESDEHDKAPSIVPRKGVQGEKKTVGKKGVEYPEELSDGDKKTETTKDAPAAEQKLNQTRTSTEIPVVKPEQILPAIDNTEGKNSSKDAKLDEKTNVTGNKTTSAKVLYVPGHSNVEMNHKKKPKWTTGEGDDDGKGMPSSPTQKEIGMPRKVDYIVPVVITIMATPVLGIAAFVLYTRGRDCWDKRHYRRMDFLIDGMYND